MRITDLGPHPGRILIVFVAPIAFAITGFLHLVADGDAPDIYTGLKGHAGRWIAIHLRPHLISYRRDRYCTDAIHATTSMVRRG
jgi:hypothetical protein